MPQRNLPSPISKRQFRAAKCAAVRDTLGPLTAVVTGLFTLLLLAVFLIGFGELTWPLAGVETFSALFVLCIHVAVRRYRVPDALVHPVVVLLALLALARCSAQLYYWGSPRDTTNFAVLMAATGLVSLSVPWSAFIMALNWASWLAISRWVHPHADWSHYIFFLMWATGLAAVVQVVRQRLLLRLLQAEARHQMLVERVPMITYVDEAVIGGRPLYISPQLERVLGYTPQEWLSRPDFWSDCLYPQDKAATLSAMRDHIRDCTNWELEYRVVARDGRVIWIQDRARRLEAEWGQPALTYGIMIDITEQKRGDALRTGANRVFEQLAAGAPLSETLAVMMRAAEDIHVGTVGSILTLDDNNRLWHLAGPSLPDFFSDAVDGLAIGPTAGCCGAAAFFRQRVVSEDISTDPNWAAHRDVALRAGLRSCWAEPIFSSTGRVLGTIAIYYKQLRLPRPLDLELIRTAARLAGMAIERLQTEAQMASYRDHLEELVAERTRQLELSLEQLRHSERLAAVGTLAAGIAHEINNPIGMILLSAEQALYHVRASDENDAIARLLEDILANTRRCGHIVKNVLRFARRHEPAERWPLDVNAVVQQAIDLTRVYATRHSSVVETSYSDEPLNVVFNPVELEQVFVNLIRNAIESGSGAPHIKITTSRVEDMARITVSDNGRGIPEEDRSRIFDPFYTTRQPEGGTGLGLSLAYGIVSDYGGAIQVEGAVGSGTTMIVEIPIHALEAVGATIADEA